MSPVILTANGS